MKIKHSNKPSRSRRDIAKQATEPSVQRILATTDFSIESHAGLRCAMALAEQLKAAVNLLHVVEVPSRMSGMEAVFLARKDSDVLAVARKELGILAERECKGIVTVTCSVHSGKPVHEITAAAEGDAADLIVIATHGHTGAEPILLGSTAERVVRHAPCPVLTVPTCNVPTRTAKSPPFRLKTLLVPIDFSNTSIGALEWAKFLASHFGAKLILLHVAERFPIDYLLGRDLMNQTIVPLMKQAKVELERMAESVRKSTGLETSVVIRDGAPFEEICQAAKSVSADMIVLTTHGYTGLKHVWLGSTAERVVRHANCLVLTVR